MGQYFSHEYVYMGDYVVDQEKSVDRNEWIADLYCQPIKDAFSESSKNIKDIPILEFVDDKMGTTDYIDMIEASDMSHPIMRGCDKYKRPFIAFKFIIMPNTNDYVKPREIVHTLFQKNTNDPNIWCWGSYYFPRTGILSSSTYLTDLEYPNLKTKLKILLNGETINSYIMTCITSPNKDPIKGGGRYLVKLSC